MSKSNSEQEEKIFQNEAYLNQPGVREELFKKFAPTFYFHKEENSFPLHPDEFVKNIIEVKYKEYDKIRSGSQRPLTDSEKKEMEIIEKFFFTKGKKKEFDHNYIRHSEDAEFKAMMSRDPQTRKNSQFLVFDEKKYGYKIGEKIEIKGVPPDGHPKHDKNKPTPPIVSSIIPTEEGFFIQYEYTYAFNAPIKGTGWLRDLLPSSIADKADNFGLHYGDCEGVGIYVNVDSQGEASLKSMQTFAHGRGFAREVEAKDCTIGPDGRVCVFVGLGGHPSYADNFVGRNKAMDVVGDKYKMTPDKFIDASPDKVKAKSEEIPNSLYAFQRLADSNPMIHTTTCYPKNAEELKKQSQHWHKYKPVLFITKTWNKIKSTFTSFFKEREDPQPIPSISLKNISTIRTKDTYRDNSREKPLTQEISQNKKPSFVQKVSTKKQMKSMAR